jgi:hypothetical protein
MNENTNLNEKFHLLDNSDDKNSKKDTKSKGVWTIDEDNLLLSLKKNKNISTWIEISSFFNNKNPKQCSYRYNKLICSAQKSKWTKEEDNKLQQLIEYYGENYNMIKKYFSNKCEKDIKERFYKIINLNLVSFTNEEDHCLINIYKKKNKSLTQDEIQLIKSKGIYAVRRRINLLLKLRGIEFDESIHSLNSSYFNSNNTNETISKEKIYEEKIIIDYPENFQINNKSLSNLSYQVKKEKNDINNIFNIHDFHENSENILENINNIEHNENNNHKYNHNISQMFQINYDIHNSNIENMIKKNFNSEDSHQQEVKKQSLHQNVSDINFKNSNLHKEPNHQQSLFLNNKTRISHDTSNILLEKLTTESENKKFFNLNIDEDNLFSTKLKYEIYDESFDKNANSFFTINNQNIDKGSNENMNKSNNENEFYNLISKFSDNTLTILVDKKKNLEEILKKYQTISNSFFNELKSKIDISKYNITEEFLHQYNFLCESEKKLYINLSLLKSLCIDKIKSGINFTVNDIKEELKNRLDVLIQIVEINQNKIKLSSSLFQYI